MAVGLRRIFRLNIGLTNSLLSKTNFINGGVRSLYTEQDLGIPSYENIRYIFRNQFVSIEDTFRVKMKEICQENNGVIFTEDLKAMVHLAQGNKDDLQLVTDMLLKFSKPGNEGRYRSYIFGPVVARMLYYLNEPQTAISLFQNPALNDVFLYQTSIRIMFCLLLKHQMYQEIIDIFTNVLSLKGDEFAYVNAVLLYAAYYKQNTPEAAVAALEHWKRHSKIRLPSSRSTAMVAHLIIKHNNCENALELLSTSNKMNSIGIRSLKVLAYTRLGRYLQIIPLFTHATEQRDTIPHRHGFYADVIYELEENLQTNNPREAAEITTLINKLKLQNRIETNRTLEEYLFRPLINLKNNERPVNKGQYYDNENERSEYKFGLKNLL